MSDFLKWVSTLGKYKMFTVFMGLFFQLFCAAAIVFGVLKVTGIL